MFLIVENFPFGGPKQHFQSFGGMAPVPSSGSDYGVCATGCQVNGNSLSVLYILYA